MTNKQSFKILADKMDERERPLEIIRELKAAGIQIPEKYKHLETMAERKHWRRDPKIIETVKKAARRAAKNDGLPKQLVERVSKNMLSGLQDKERELHEKAELPSAVVNKKDYEDKWPFANAETATIKKDKNAIAVVINDKEYSLNGVAQMRYGYQFVSDAGEQVEGVSVKPFIKIGQKLDEAQNNERTERQGG